AYVAQGGSGADLFDAQPHAFVGGVDQATRQYGRFANLEHAAGVAKPAVLDDGDIDIHDVAVLQHLLARNAVTDHVVHGRADGGGEGRVTRRCVAYRGRFCVQHIGDVVHADTIELTCGDPGPHELGKMIECGSRALAGGAHFVEVGGIGDETTHGLCAGLSKKE